MALSLKSSARILIFLCGGTVRFGGRLEDYPHPELDLDAFVHLVEQRCATAGHTWDPVEKRNKPWIDTRKLVALYRKKSGCIIS
jgi:hypothetical protein